MGYKAALEKAWNELSRKDNPSKLLVQFLSDNYEVDIESKSVSSLSCNIPPKDFIVILILHYLASKIRLNGLPEPKNDWISFKELNGGDFYYPVFKKRTIDVIFRKFGQKPEALKEAAARFKAKESSIGDGGVIIEPFEGIVVLITIWKGDEELSGQADILFDRVVPEILCTEDITVLSEIIAHRL